MKGSHASAIIAVQKKSEKEHGLKQGRRAGNAHTVKKKKKGEHPRRRARMVHCKNLGDAGLRETKARWPKEKRGVLQERETSLRKEIGMKKPLEREVLER